MRLIGILETHEEAERFAAYAKKQGKEVVIDPTFETPSGRISYQIWVVDEDHFGAVSTLYEQFCQNPNDPVFQVSRPSMPSEEPPKKVIEKPFFPFTALVLFLCVLTFLLESMQLYELESVQDFTDIPSIQRFFLFDEGLIQDRMPVLPQFLGVYSYLITFFKGENIAAVTGPLFTNISHGQLWRFFTPCLLHAGFLHILFNMLWVWILSRPIEERIGTARLVLFSLIAACFSNTAQYLMSGPYFEGYSGVIMALAGFVWMRKRRAPWEGYPVHPMTLRFLFIFVGALSALTFLLFFVEAFTSYGSPIRIANTAHLSGAFIGAFLGNFSFFAQKVRR